MSVKQPPIEVTATTADFSLKKKLGPDVSIREVFTEDVIASADSYIEESRKDFFGDAAGALQEMETAYHQATTSNSAAPVKSLQRIAYSLKGQSETLGFELLALACKSLCDFCGETFRAGEKDHLVVLRKHIDTIQVIVRDRLENDGGALGKELIGMLHLLNQKYA